MIRVAAVQAAPVWLEAKGTLEKTIALIEEAGRNNVKLLGFGESWLPGYPITIFMKPPMVSMEIVIQYRKNAIAVDGPEMKAIGQAAKRAGTWVMLGYAERDKGSIYCSQALLNDLGQVVMNRRKLKPTHMERTVWGEGRVEGLTVVETPFGIVGGLNCWEHLQPINRQGMFQLGEQIHVASWPALSAFRGVEGTRPLSQEVAELETSSYALQGGCFALMACLLVSEEDRLKMCMGDESLLNFVEAGGGSAVIFGPDGDRLTKRLDDNAEALAIADIDLDAIEAVKVLGDPAGHYFRPDVARYVLERSAAPINAL